MNPYKQHGKTQRGNASERNIKNLSSDLRDMVSEVVKELGYEVLYQLRDRTPVDTGWARANWTISVGGYKTGTYGERPKKGTKGFPISGSDADSLVSLESFHVTTGTLWITNNVPYIQYLNEFGGSRCNMPGLFVESSLNAAVNIVSSNRRR